MTGPGSTDFRYAQLDRDELVAEIVRLRAMLARTGLDTSHLATSNARAIGASHAELLAAGTANEDLRRANADLEVSRAALAASEDRYRAVLESATDYAIITSDPNGRITGWNAGARNVIGWEEAEVLGQPTAVFFTPEDREAGVPGREMRTALEEGRSVDERWHVRRDGSRFWASGQLMPLRDGVTPLGFLKILRDHTGQRADAERLRASEERFRLIVESATEYAIFTLDREGVVTSWNSGAERILGWGVTEIVGRNAALLYTPEDQAAGQPVAEMRAGVAEGRIESERWMLRRDGTRFWASQTLTRLLGHDGEGRGFLKILRDRTGQRAAEQALRESEARFRHMADSAPALIWMTDETGAFTFTNMHFEYLFGRPAAEFLGDGWRQVLLPEEAERVRRLFTAAFRGRRTFRAELRVRDRDGRVRWLRCEGVPRLDDSGRFLGYTGCDVDITEARLAAEELERRVEERTGELMAAEASLRQAQKMEAVGQLTGGIAHDFNNMLQAIGGSLDMLWRRVEQGRAEEATRFVEGARQTVARAAALTHRLLAFARRQALEPRPVEPDMLIEGMAELIRRTVGPSVQVELRTRDGVWTVLCDPNQLENALLNLAINARDAMPEGGRLTIGTDDVHLSEADVATQEGAEPGDYVEVSVLDSGVGMDAAVIARAFEPFFTTKPIGQGTGLGLSQVYGFVRQSNGLVRLDSAPGRGTAVRLYLPRHQGVGDAGETVPVEAAGAPQASTGATVLLVEDETQVREVAAERLRELGYHVLEAADGPAALRVLHGSRGSRVDLLVTDVGLPAGLNGRQVAEMAREARPGLKVLFITGYAGSALEEHLAPGMEVIGKPFTLDALAARVRSIVEGERLVRS